MTKIGIKYISPGEMGIPAVNSGRWNIATNMRYDFNRLLGEVGIGGKDNDTVALFIRFIREGMFLCAAKRKYRVREKKWSYEALWVFVPGDIEISGEDLVSCVEQLPILFEHKYAFGSPEEFEDILPDIFFREFPPILKKDESILTKEESKDNLTVIDLEDAVEMTGSRIGYVSLERRDDLKCVLSIGFRKQYRNFGLIYLTDNPIKVESSLPRVFLPELQLNGILNSDGTIPESSEEKDEPVMENSDNDISGDTENSEHPENQEINEAEEEQKETDEPEKESCSNTSETLDKTPDDDENTENQNFIEKMAVNDDPLFQVNLGKDHQLKSEPDSYHFKTANQKITFHWYSFLIGILAAGLLYILIQLVR